MEWRTTIWPTYTVLFHLFFLLYISIWPKIRVLIDLFLFFPHDHLTKMYGSYSYILSFCTTIQPKIMILIDLFFLLVHNHLTKIRGHSYSYSLIYYFLNCANILCAIFIVVLPLYFVGSIHFSTALKFCMQYSWLYEVFTLSNKSIINLRNFFWPKFCLTKISSNSSS